jgi:hypothetical protein
MNSLDRIFNSINEARKAKGKAMIPSHAEKKGGEKSKLGKDNPYDHDHKVEEGNGKKNKPKPKPTAAEREALVAKHGEKVGNAMADQRGLPKKSMQTESSHMKKKKKLIGKQAKLDRNKNGELDTEDFRMLRGESKEIIAILDLIKEAYQEELISEEAFLAIADPIMRSLIEKKK